MSAKEAIINRLRFSPSPLAVHEFKIMGYNENNLATRCAELAKEGKIIGDYRKGETYKEWRLVVAEKDGQGLMI